MHALRVISNRFIPSLGNIPLSQFVQQFRYTICTPILCCDSSVCCAPFVLFKNKNKKSNGADVGITDERMTLSSTCLFALKEKYNSQFSFVKHGKYKIYFRTKIK